MRRLSAALIAGFLAVLPGSAVAEIMPDSIATAAGAGLSAPMRLGVDPPDRAERQPLVPHSGAKPGHRMGQCQKWRAMSYQLGETFAGHALRESVLKRICLGIGNEHHDDIWDWPWSGVASGRLLPPRAHRSIGAWQIRCGLGSNRHRCALLHRTSMPGAEPGAAAQIIVAHFVIDMVAGRESVLWRVFVPQMQNNERDTRDARIETRADAPATVMSARERPSLAYQIGEQELADKFSTCAAGGCMMEANLRHAGVVMSGLWDGLAVRLRLPDQAGGEYVVRVPARGFRAGLAELIRLRREELRRRRR